MTNISNDIEAQILKQMNEEAGSEYTEESLQPSETENISEKKNEPIKLKKLTKKEVKATMDKIQGFLFRDGDVYFKVVSVNTGRKRFVAEIVNEVEENKVEDIIGKNRRKKK